MKWIKAISQKPKNWNEVVFRTIPDKYVLSTSDVWRFHDDCIEMNNENSRCGKEYRYENIEWLDEDAPDTEELEKILEWGCSQGYKKPEGIEYRIEIEGEVYSIPEAVEMYLKTKQ
jgi:hypothetical protein